MSAQSSPPPAANGPVPPATRPVPPATALVPAEAPPVPPATALVPADAAPVPPAARRLTRAWHGCLRVFEFMFAVFCGLLVFGLLVSGPGTLLTGMWPAGFVLPLILAACVSLPILLRRRSPVLSLVLALGGCGAILLAGGQITRGPVVPLAAVLYVVAATRHRQAALAGLAGSLALLTVQGVVLRDQGVGSGNAIATGLIIVIAWTVGYAVRQRRAYSANLREQIAATAVTEERLRIARELHDVVAHSMTVVAVQAGFGEYVFDSQPAKAREALNAIQAVTADALTDMQRMLGALRQAETAGGGAAGRAQAEGGAAAGAQPGQETPGRSGKASRGRASSRAAGPAATAAPGGARQGTPGAASAAHAAGPEGGPVLRPAPGLADIDRLVATTTGAGIRVDVQRCGQVRDLPAGIDASAFRIVQEALTNVVKHSGADSCLVRLGYQPLGLSIEVSDPGPAGAGAGGPTGPRAVLRTAHLNGVGHLNGAARTPGHGVIGMRERVSLCRGEFSAGPLPDGGFRVWARLPLGRG